MTKRTDGDDGLQLARTRDGAVGIVRVSGDLSQRNASRLIGTLCEAIEESPGRAVVCDVSGLAGPLAAHHLTAFPTALRRSGPWPSSSLLLAAPNEDLGQALRAYRMSRYLPVRPDVESALTDASAEAGARRVRLLLPGEPATLHVVRRALRDAWPPGGDLSSLEVATLVLNELATNAVRHVGQPYEVSLAASATGVLVAVTDAERTEPFLRPALGPEVTNGRGLQLVSALSTAWGVRLVAPEAKTVWAECGLPAVPPGEVSRAS